jgi:hypothetical protein
MKDGHQDTTLSEPDKLRQDEYSDIFLASTGRPMHLVHLRIRSLILSTKLGSIHDQYQTYIYDCNRAT